MSSLAVASCCCCCGGGGAGTRNSLFVAAPHNMLYVRILFLDCSRAAAAAMVQLRTLARTHATNDDDDEAEEEEEGEY